MSVDLTDWRVRFLHDLVATPSPTGDTDAAVDVFVRTLTERGFDAHRDAAGNAVAIAGRGKREILLVGHIDTVPGDLPVGITEDGYLTGRGSVDAKGCLATFAAAAEAFLDDPDWRIVVVGTCDEEGRSRGARHLIDRYDPEVLVIGEPSGVAGVTIAYKGITRVRYDLVDDRRHTGGPWPTVMDRAVAFWSAVQDRCREHESERLFDVASARLTRMDSAFLDDGRERVTFEGNVRTPPGFDHAAFEAFLRDVAGDGLVTIDESLPAWVADKNTALARGLVAGIREAGERPRYLRKTGTSEMNVLAPAWGCPVVAYGPGDSHLDHTPDERVSLAEYSTATRVLTHALRHVARAPLEHGPHATVAPQ